MDQLFSLLPQSRQPVLQSLELAHLLYSSRSLFHLSYQSLYHPSTPSLPSLSIFSFAPSRSILLTQIYSFLHPSLPPFILLATAFFNWSLRVSSARRHRSSADIPPATPLSPTWMVTRVLSALFLSLQKSSHHLTTQKEAVTPSLRTNFPIWGCSDGVGCLKGVPITGMQSAAQDRKWVKNAS